MLANTVLPVRSTLPLEAEAEAKLPIPTFFCSSRLLSISADVHPLDAVVASEGPKANADLVTS